MTRNTPRCCELDLAAGSRMTSKDQSQASDQEITSAQDQRKTERGRGRHSKETQDRDLAGFEHSQSSG